jgi:transposase-like protein
VTSALNTIVCPRCEESTVRVMTTSPVPGKWTMYVCDTCFYSYRSTEKASATEPASFPQDWKVDPADIPSMPAMPPVPQRR